jgi:small-conductance mechanosensitive channel
MWQTKARLAISFANESLASTIPQALIILGIGAAGILAAWIFIKLGDWISKRSDNYKSQWRVIFMVLCFASVLISLTIGFNAAGFNFWTVALSYGFIALIFGSGMGPALQSTFAYALVSLSRAVEEYQHIEMDDVRGQVEEIGFLQVLVRYSDPNSNRTWIHHIPTYQFLSGRYRILEKEAKQSRKMHSV